MKTKNGLVILVSAIVGVLAAVAATLVVIKFLKKKKSQLECTDYVFENDFDEQAEQDEIEL